MDCDVELNGLSFRCRIDGPSAAAPWLVFSNSLLTTLAMWDGQVEVLCADFRILRYDQRGHGATQVPPQSATFEQLGADVEAMLDHFDIQYCTFVGLSMGVPTALQLVRSCPERIERLVLCDGLTRTQPGGARGWEDRIELARRDGMAAFAAVTADRWFGPAARQGKGARAVETMIAETPLAGFLACAQALQDYDYDDVLEAICVPSLLLVGEADGGLPAIMADMARRTAGARYGVVPAAGHISNVENPAAFNERLTAFLREEWR